MRPSYDAENAPGHLVGKYQSSGDDTRILEIHEDEECLDLRDENGDKIGIVSFESGQWHLHIPGVLLIITKPQKCHRFVIFKFSLGQYCFL